MPPFSELDAINSTRLNIEPIYKVVRAKTTKANSFCNSCSYSSSFSEGSVKVIEQKLQPQNKISLSFYPFVEVIAIPDIDDYSDEEIEACWFSPEETDFIRSVNRRTALAIHAGIRHDDTPMDTLRGLESQVLQYATIIRSQRIREHSWMAVLDEQYKQRQRQQRIPMETTTDPEQIRACYTFFTKYASDQAAELAQEDEAEALRILQQEDYLEEVVDLNSNLNSYPAAVSTVISAERILRKCWLFDPSSWFPRLIQDAMVDASS